MMLIIIIKVSKAIWLVIKTMLVMMVMMMMRLRIMILIIMIKVSMVIILVIKTLLVMMMMMNRRRIKMRRRNHDADYYDEGVHGDLACYQDPCW